MVIKSLGLSFKLIDYSTDLDPFVISLCTEPIFLIGSYRYQERNWALKHLVCYIKWVSNLQLDRI